MSKQSKAKEVQEYNPKPIQPICSNCIHYQSDTVTRSGWDNSIWTEEGNIRCGIGGFAIKKTATCKLYQQKL